MGDMHSWYVDNNVAAATTLGNGNFGGLLTAAAAAAAAVGGAGKSFHGGVLLSLFVVGCVFIFFITRNCVNRWK